MAALEHDPEKWDPVFRKDHARPKKTQLDLEKLEPVSCLREAALAGCLFV
jgi:hypothetical protein